MNVPARSHQCQIKWMIHNSSCSLKEFSANSPVLFPIDTNSAFVIILVGYMISILMCPDTK